MKISVALCTYNGEKFIKEQLNSILYQTRKVDEIVICDDGSTDGTLAILGDYENNFPDIFRIFRNEKNLRSVKNFEKAISLCSYDIIFLSDQDDIWLSEKVESYLAFFEKNPQICVLCSNGSGIDENGNNLDVITIWDIPRFLKDSGAEINFFQIIAFVGNIATGAAMAIRRDFIKDIIPFPEINNYHHDEWIALVASSKDCFGFIDSKLFKYRMHDKQQVGGVFYPNTLKVRKTLVNYFDINKNIKNFKFYKKFLKRLVASKQKFVELGEYPQSEKFAKDQIGIIEQLFKKTQKEMHDKYIIRAKILEISDKFLKKRQL